MQSKKDETRDEHRGDRNGRAATPRPVWDPDLPATQDFRAQWEAFLRHVVEDAPFRWDFFAGARGVQLAELGLRSAREGRRLEVPELTA